MNCLICYKPLEESEKEIMNHYHKKCVMKAFGVKEIPIIDIDEKQLKSYAKNLISENITITGVQPKLSLWLEKNSSKNKTGKIRFTIVDNKSNYIIKPQSMSYKSLPENEDLCMHLAEEFGIKTAKHCLIQLESKNLAYITKRFDRLDGNYKLACEDFCQLSESLTEHKYRGSYEMIGKTLKKYSSQSGLDLFDFFTLVIFSFITGNADMHLKNFSMLENEASNIFSLSPAYDLVSTLLVIQNETEQLSLALNGKRNKILKNDFDIFAKSLGLSEKQRDNCYNIFYKKKDKAIWWIDNSFLPLEQKDKLKNILTFRLDLLIC